MAWKDIFNWYKFPPPEFVKQYEKQQERRIPKEKRIFELEFLVLDTETTGLDLRSDYLISYGAVLIKGYHIMVNSAREYFLPPKKYSREAIKVHGIVKERPTVTKEQLIRNFITDASNRILVGHHVGFDLAMLEKAGKPVGLRKIKNPALDTFHLAVRLDMGKYYDPRNVPIQEYSLDSLCLRYGIPLDDRHTAAGDAFLTAQLLVKMLKLAETKGVRTYGELMG
ncbi:PolC-type DNA polymerase III [Negadavirga shengliensis]|uniref:PolC-type DNA polymerase III n=1 Tax=Negadavirga shengliensis TaxID=1389218 RepID=A0ABV9T546_9BACT